MARKSACPFCSSFNVKPWVAGKWMCMSPACRKAFYASEMVSVEYVPKNPRKQPSTRARADKQERRVAKQVNGRQTIASGQTPIDKADVKVAGELRIECKTTEKKSFTLKREDLLKIMAQAQGDEMPVFMIEFVSPSPSVEFAVIPTDWFIQLLEAYRAQKQ